jgi:hypothetical protein
MYLDGLSLEFVTQPNRMYTVNLKAQGIATSGALVARDLFGVFTTDGSNVVSLVHSNNYGQHATGAFVVGDIALAAGTGTIQVAVVGAAIPNITNWTAFMWGVEMIKP